MILATTPVCRKQKRYSGLKKPTFVTTVNYMKALVVLLLSALIVAPGLNGADATPAPGNDHGSEHETHHGSAGVVCHSMPSQASGQHLHACGGIVALLPLGANTDFARDGEIQYASQTSSYFSPSIDPPERPPDSASA